MGIDNPNSHSFKKSGVAALRYQSLCLGLNLEGMMFHKTLAECFPYDDLPPMFECVNNDCFYLETLLTMDECSWRDKWCYDIEDLRPEPICPSCAKPLKEFEDPDGKIQTFV